MNAPYRVPERVTTGASLTAYWPFIDGLRAVSILAVVLYHVGVPHVTGGYVGVDVFFVISGFLIISQIVEGLRRGSFTFGGFWARRVLRILPPNLLVLVSTVAIAPFVLIMPDEFRDLAKEARDAPLMLINHLLLKQQGYFDTASDTKPAAPVVAGRRGAVLPRCTCPAGALVVVAAWLKRPRLRPPLLFWAALAVFVGSLVGCTADHGGRTQLCLLSLGAEGMGVRRRRCGRFPYSDVSRLPQRAQAGLAATGMAAIIGAAVFYQPRCSILPGQ